MFLVSDTRAKRNRLITILLKISPAVAVIIAAADFEWTCRRCILACGKSPTKEIKLDSNILYHCSSLKKYRMAWDKEVTPRLSRDLNSFISDISYFENTAYKLRHKLVHGSSGSTGMNHARQVVKAFLAVSTRLTIFAKENNEPILGRKIIRRKAR